MKLPSSATWPLLVLSACISLALPACKHAGQCEKVAVEISSDHPHSAKVSADRVKQGAAATYRVHGDGHDHAFRLTAEDMQKLERGETVTTRTSSANAHLHEVSVRCKE